MTTPHDDPEEQRRNIKRAQIAQAAAEYYDKTGENPFIQLFNINESLKKVIAERDALKSKVAKQRNSNAALQRSLEQALADKADHTFRLRQILIGMLDGDARAATKARMEVGRNAANPTNPTEE